MKSKFQILDNSSLSGINEIKLNYRPWKPDDVDDFLPRLKSSDILEAKAVFGLNIKTAINKSIEKSDYVWAIIIDENIEGIIGIAPHPDFYDVGIPWMLSTAIVEEYPRQILIEGRKWLELFHNHYRVLTNTADSRNRRTINWLTRIGFSIKKIIPGYGFEQREFTQFVSRQPEIKNRPYVNRDNLPYAMKKLAGG